MIQWLWTMRWQGVVTAAAGGRRQEDNNARHVGDGDGDGAGDRIFSDIFRVAIFWIASPNDFPQIPCLPVARQTPHWRF